MTSKSRADSTRTSMAIFRKPTRIGPAWSKNTGNEGGDMSAQAISAVNHRMATPVVVLSWICRITAAIILLQTLFFKFTAAPESVYIFTKVGAEPWGRIGSGVAELTAAALLLTPRFVWIGALLAIAVMAGAIAT